MRLHDGNWDRAPRVKQPAFVYHSRHYGGLDSNKTTWVCVVRSRRETCMSYAFTSNRMRNRVSGLSSSRVICRVHMSQEWRACGECWLRVELTSNTTG